MFSQYYQVMYKIKVIHMSFLPILDERDMTTCKYFVLVGIRNSIQRKLIFLYLPMQKRSNMVNYQLCQLSKYHGLKLLVDLINHMNFKNPLIRFPKNKRKNVNTQSCLIIGIKLKACDIKSRTYLELRDKQKSCMTKGQVFIGNKFKESS